MNSYVTHLSQAKIKALNKLNHKKYRYSTNSFFCEGWRIFTAAKVSKPNDIVEIIINENFKNSSNYLELMKFCSQAQIPVYICEDKIFKTISNEISPSGIMFIMKLKYFQNSDLSDLNENNCIYLENISDPGNLGTIIRTAAWFGFRNIFLSNDSVDPFNAKVVRASAGGIFNVHIHLNITLDSIIEFGIQNKYEFIGTTLENCEALSNWKVTDKNIIFFGNEANGLTEAAKQALNKKITIPGSGKMESLNLSVSSGIVLNHLYQNLKK